MTRRVTIVLVLAAMVAHPAASAGEDAPAGCAPGSAGSAAARLIHTGAEVAERTTIAGFQSALALEPLVVPGVRHRLIRAGDLWCDATGFNAAWRLNGRPLDAVSVASAFAQVAAAPYFDGVTVTRANEVLPGIVKLDTHARTNGITASWTVVVDGGGVRRAVWTSTRLGVAPFTAELGGVSALPGVTRTYARSGGGAVRALEPILPDPGQPEIVTQGTTADDFVIQIHYGETPVSPNIGQDTGVDVVDYLRFVRRVTLENYQEFYDWGFRKDWSSNVGIVHVDSAISAVCWACVFIREDFNIHISSAIVEILLALGWEYPDEKDAYSNVIGHEMTHNWQHAYYKPQQSNASAHVSFVEGTARFQESIHDYSGVSHQPLSLIYHTGREIPGVSLAANSCNGWAGQNIEGTFAQGPFTGKTYNACYFWLSWFDRHGTSGIVDLFTVYRDHVNKPAPRQVIDAIQDATDGTFAEDLAAFAQASITGKGYEWAAPGTEGPVRDWGVYLQRWSPPMLAGGQMSRTLSNGGVMARELDQGGYVTWEPADISVYAVRDDGTTATRRLIDPTDEDEDFFVPAPAPGERVWLVGVSPAVGATPATVRLGPTSPVPPPD